MCVESVDEQSDQTIFRIKEVSPYCDLDPRQVVVQHTPTPFSSYPPLPIGDLASNVVRTIHRVFKVPGIGELVFVTSLFEDGSNITEGPFVILEDKNNST